VRVEADVEVMGGSFGPVRYTGSLGFVTAMTDTDEER
jgi:hypothetical protein